MPETEEWVFPAQRRASDPMLAEHWARYRFVRGMLHGRLLDLGCGSGYGSRELAAAPGIAEVVGLDHSPEALFWARRYYADPAVRFVSADLERRGWEEGLGGFDGVTAFEVIEHLAREDAFWAGIRRVLRPRGTLWLSVPLGRGRGVRPADPFHVFQPRRSEVAAMFDNRWDGRFYGQAGTWIEPWEPGRRYRTMLVRALLRAERMEG